MNDILAGLLAVGSFAHTGPRPMFLRNHGDPRKWRKHFGARKARGPKPGWSRGARLKESALLGLIYGRLLDRCRKVETSSTVAS